MSWTVINYSAIGTKHQEQGLPCQDYSNYRHYDDVVIGAVADGAGSAKHSDVGAKLAVETTLSFLSGTEQFQKDPGFAQWSKKPKKVDKPPPNQVIRQLATDLCKKVLTALTEEAENMDCQPEDFNCTLLVVIATSTWFAGIQIGDGFIVVRSEDQNPELVFKPDKGEFANETTFVTSEDVESQLQVKVLPPQKFICVASDGLEAVAIRFSDWMAFPPFFQPLEECLEEETSQEEKEAYLQTFLESERLNQRTGDDKTVLLCLNTS
ncbi:protein phosphatase 2C domain-containing protein [Euhalothece natronophila Z-M001]|uniref:Protein phosphatase 2C domain-containing protein n=1 Tax=Euhalothece natronophila Z-M001 TaxID=522448 RepID=A0A5B8NQU7_9CHRO|nr:PP2C family serine/threonine-protein phosphatase [Euhalothece natronophila]QDZ40871.1 protein phosphatase 2C domain-containing protein [Euhalothece natronophila Z-M001]